MKVYEAPELFVDEYVADTMIASSGDDYSHLKNGNFHNQNCYGCRNYAGDTYGENLCIMFPGDEETDPWGEC